MDTMRRALALRPLTADETQQLKAGLRCPEGMTVRRSQILLASAKGYSPTQIASVVGCKGITVTRVISDFHARGVASVHEERRQPGPRRSSRPRIEEREPGITAALERLVTNEIAGDPMGRASWVRSSLRKLSDALAAQGYRVDPCTVRHLLQKMGFTLKRNQKRRGGSQHPNRDEQFRYIAERRATFASAGLPVISVDTKKKELIGNFRNQGRSWCRAPAEVNEHDFTSTAECRAVPFGIYDLGRNRGHVRVGVSNDTPEFAATAIAEWWRSEAQEAYPLAKELLILADCGGTNGYRFRAWKLNLQEKLCDDLGLTVTVCHYPPGCSKWNPIEHRLFSQISTNWAGQPLRSLEIMLGYIRGTTTRTGLAVTAQLDGATYRKGQQVTAEEVSRLRVKNHDTCSDWNYTLSPR
jgi:transposase